MTDIVEQLRQTANSVYAERNKLVALLARLYPSGTKRTAIEGWDECWHGCVYIDFAFMHEAVGNSVCQVRYTKGRSRSVIYKTPNFNGTWRE